MTCTNNYNGNNKKKKKNEKQTSTKDYMKISLDSLELAMQRSINSASSHLIQSSIWIDKTKQVPCNSKKSIDLIGDYISMASAERNYAENDMKVVEYLHRQLQLIMSYNSQ